MCILRFSFGPISPGGGQVGPNCWREFWFSEMQAVLLRFQQFIKAARWIQEKEPVKVVIVPVIWCRLYLVTNDAPLCLMFLSSRYLTAAWFADEKWNLPGGCSSCQLFLFTEYIECTSMSCALWKVEIWKLSAIMSATSPASTSSTMLDSSMVTMSNCGAS